MARRLTDHGLLSLNQIISNDLGFTGSGGALTDSDTVNIVNDAKRWHDNRRQSGVYENDPPRRRIGADGHR